RQRQDERAGVTASPMQASVPRLTVPPGQHVSKGDLRGVLESMKMENYVYAPVDGVVNEIFATAASSVDGGETLLTLDVEGAHRDAKDTKDAQDKGERA
ncbi:MAG: acetyl-CoA carboxylase biotin carboxyl carrier protein subunit, partial [Bifidobacterium castoris]|nr:acetyl-CoA carboxylase biotin carboxyl carrier protein subunit [Bifidobacterium castoris]